MPMLRKVVFATLILAVTSATAMACDCVTRSEAESFANADVVFIGKATGTFTFMSEATTFEISRWLKGQQPESVLVFSGPSNCDVSFLNGYTYIVYAKTINGQLMTSSCSGTKVIGRQYELRREPLPCATYDTSLSYQRIAAITALSVTFSVSLGLLVGAIKRRFRK
jgi:hypothetical protein